MDHYDVLIVGAGPAGCSVARRCAAAGLSVGLFEEHSTVGLPRHCAGLVTERAFTYAALKADDTVVSNDITAAIIESPSGRTLHIGGDRPHALVIDRVRFDQALAQQAQDAGAILALGSKAVAVAAVSEKITLTYKTGETVHTATGSALVGADGPRSFVRTAAGLPPPKEFLDGVGLEVADVDLDPRTVLMFTGAAVAPGFFAWVIPMNRKGTEARVGLCKVRARAPSMQQCAASLLQRSCLSGAFVMRRYGGVVPLGPVEPTVASRVLLVGDAAAQVKPTSGGGLVPGLICAAKCAEAVIAARRQSSKTDHHLASYQTSWKKAIGTELMLGMAFRRLFRSLSDSDLERCFAKAGTDAALAAVDRYGDIDYPSRVLLPLLGAAPSLLTQLPSAVIASLRDGHRLREDGGGGT